VDVYTAGRLPRGVPASGFRPPLRLEGRLVALVPLERAHAEGLARAGEDPEIWRFLTVGPRGNLKAMTALIDLLLSRQTEGTDLPFTVVYRADGALIGMTRYLEIDRDNRRAEIGGTWYARSFQRTPVNTECKRLLLAHAFDVEGVQRVQLKTDLRNLRSQRAIERIGAIREGVLRDHVLMPDGYLRSSVVYSIIRPEWPEVRARLDAILDRPWSEGASRGRRAEGPGTTASGSEGR
jgi:N-acetyltransferase